MRGDGGKRKRTTGKITQDGEKDGEMEEEYNKRKKKRPKNKKKIWPTTSLTAKLTIK
jgi:hypothetical protein